MRFHSVIYPGEIAVITFFGDLDSYTTNKMRQQLSKSILQGEVRYIVWQMQHVNFMDSAGVGLILGRMRELAAVDGQMLLLNPNRTIEKIFQYSGLAQYVLHGSEQDALLHARGIVYGQ